MAIQSKSNILDGLASRVREMIEKGEHPPWQKPWKPSPISSMPLHNPVTERPYAGALNTLTLFLESAMRGYEDPRWLGYKQAREKGWNVRKGEKSAHIYVPIQIKCKDADGHPIMEPDPATGKLKPKIFQAFKSVPVFNAEQIEGIPPLEVPKRMPEVELPKSPELDAIAEVMGVKIVTTTDRAFYSSQVDRIGLPSRDAFLDQGGYESTKAHELAHATGHESRLDRTLGNKFGSPAYAFEELIAEATAYTICRSLSLPYTGNNPEMDKEQHATYLASWSHQIKDEDLSKALDKAVSATGYIMHTLEAAKERGLVEELAIGKGGKNPELPPQQLIEEDLDLDR